MLNAKKIGVVIISIVVAGTVMFFAIKASRGNQVQNVENNTSISQEVEDQVNTETGESAVKEDLDKGSGLTEEEKNIDEAVTTIDEVEADEQRQLAANAGGSGEAEVYETGEEDVVVGKDPSLVENTENSENPKAEVVMPEGFEDGFDNMEKGANLPSEEDNAWFDSKVDEYGTVLH